MRTISGKEFAHCIDARQAARSGDYDKAIEISRQLEEDLKLKLGEKYFG